jgi:hypothetical protein
MRRFLVIPKHGHSVGDNGYESGNDRGWRHNLDPT